MKKEIKTIKALDKKSMKSVKGNGWAYDYNNGPFYFDKLKDELCDWYGC